MRSRVLNFTVVYERAEEGGYVVRVPALPGCMTEADTLEGAERMARDAIQAFCASLRKHGERVPQDVREIVETVRVRIPA
jgi:predicted RNase H-like HicB family nuclease